MPRFGLLACLLLFALPLPLRAEDVCQRDKHCADGLVCVCVRHLLAEAGHCDEMGGFCAVDKPEYAPQRRELERARVRAQARHVPDPVGDER